MAQILFKTKPKASLYHSMTACLHTWLLTYIHDQPKYITSN